MSKKLILILSFFLFACQSGRQDRNDNPNYRAQLVKALSLKLVDKKKIYRNPYKKIFRDTVVGVIGGGYGRDTFFIQSLKNIRVIDKYYYPGKIVSTPTAIDALKDGNLYFGAFGKSFMRSIGKSGAKDYFIKYMDTLFYANQVLLYKDKTVIRSMNGLFVFDTNKEQLVWKHYYSRDTEGGGNVMFNFNNYLVFNDCPDKVEQRSITCLDLNTLKVKWIKKTRNDCIDPPLYMPSNKGNLVLINGSHSLYSFNTLNGKITDMPAGFEAAGLYDAQYKQYYVKSSPNRDSLVCLDANFKQRWAIKGASYIWQKDNLLLCRYLEHQWFLVINKKNGRVIAKILNNDPSDYGAEPMQNYLLIDHIYLYK